jgi:two-component system cell cycle response regulator
MTCIAFGPQSFGTQHGEGDSLLKAITSRVAAALRVVTRHSDTVGHLGPGEFIVVAPGTGQEGAVRLADRVFEAIDRDESQNPLNDPDVLTQVRAGFCAVGGEPTTAEDLLLRATMALRKAQADTGSFRVRGFEA